MILRLSGRVLFVDASAYVSLALSKEPQHEAAIQALARLAAQRWHFVTIVPMIAEAHARLVRPLGVRAASRFVDDLYSSASTTIERTSQRDEDAARAILRRYTDKEFSYADALAFAVMARWGIRWAFSFDDHFKQYGQFHVIDGPHSWD